MVHLIMDPNAAQQSVSAPSSSKSDSGISVVVLAILGVIVIFFVILLWYLVQKNSKLNAPLPVTNQNTKQNPTVFPTRQLSPQPTVRSLTGPGQFACSALGDCKDWD